MIEPNFTPFPILETERLLLRAIETNDALDIFVHRSDDRVNTYLNDWRFTSIKQSQAFIERIQKEVAENKTILWVITQKGHHKFLGTICLWNISMQDDKAETGYTLDPAFHGKGFMNEVLVKVIDFGFEVIKLKSIDAYTHENNKGSINLLLKCNFKQGVTPKADVGSDRVYLLLKNDK